MLPNAGKERATLLPCSLPTRSEPIVRDVQLFLSRHLTRKSRSFLAHLDLRGEVRTSETGRKLYIASPKLCADVSSPYCQNGTDVLQCGRRKRHITPVPWLIVVVLRIPELVFDTLPRSTRPHFPIAICGPDAVRWDRRPTDCTGEAGCN